MRRTLRLERDVEPWDDTAYSPWRQALSLADLEAFCAEVRKTGGVDLTPVAFKRHTSGRQYLVAEVVVPAAQDHGGTVRSSQPQHFGDQETNRG